MLLIATSPGAEAIPNCCGGAPAIVPAGSEVPHEHSDTESSNGFPAGTITFALDVNANGVPNEPADKAMVEASPDLVVAPVASAGLPRTPARSGHQHNDAEEHTFGGFVLPREASANDADPAYDTFRVWDNRRPFNTTNIDGVAGSPRFPRGHGFIDVFGYGFIRATGGSPSDNKPTFCIETPPWGGPANRGDRRASMQVIRDAFSTWIALTGLLSTPTLITGLGFREVGSLHMEEGAAACPPAGSDIRVVWHDLDDGTLGETTTRSSPVRVRFDSDPPHAGPRENPGAEWEFGEIRLTGRREFHFLTTALHEVGHVIGLDEQNDADNDDVMTIEQSTGCSNPGVANGTQPCFDAIDPESRDAIRDLYSIPTPDFGDAPATYPTRLEDDGARAPTIVFEQLSFGGVPPGTLTTRESTGLPFNGDLFDDGCSLSAGVGVGSVDYVIGASDPRGSRYLVPFSRLFVAVWVDWNQDGNWTAPAVDPGELLFVDSTDPVTWPPDDGSPNVEAFSHAFGGIPAGTAVGETYMRCRLVYGLAARPGGAGAAAYLSGDMGDQGLVPLADSPDNGGEIEDCLVRIRDTTDDGIPDEALSAC